MKVLLIGCGNIGALYDYSTKEIHTHAKAFRQLGYDVDFIEPRGDIADKVKSKYGYQRKDYSEADLNKYDLITISTPTEYHFGYLMDAIKERIPVVLCEKPVAYHTDELNALLEEYKKGETKVLVNYIRRFQNQYGWLKKEIENFDEPLQSIHCNYHKGILNSASHALDTIQYLTSFQINSDNVYELNRVYDYFKEDPTISFAGHQDGISFFFRGLQIDYQVFEIDLLFHSYRVLLTKGGKETRVFKKGEQVLFKDGMTKDYMMDVVKEAESLYSGTHTNDNFEESVLLNKSLIQIIEN